MSFLKNIRTYMVNFFFKIWQWSRWFIILGTFSSSPILFSLPYTIRGMQYSNLIPIILALLPNKSQKFYVRFLEALNRIKPNLRRVNIVVGFEKAAINSFMQQFRQSSEHFFPIIAVCMETSTTRLQERYTKSSAGNFGFHHSTIWC